MSDKDIYNYCNERWELYIEKDGGYFPSKHDDVVLGEVAEKFNITKDEVFQIFIKVGQPIANNEIKNMTKEQMVQEFERIVKANKDTNLFKD